MRYIFKTLGHKYFIYCENCIKYQCKKCMGLLDKCINCNDLFCVSCDDGDIKDDDIPYCKKNIEI